MAFRNDSYTLESRINQAERERNLAEENTEKELDNFRGAVTVRQNLLGTFVVFCVMYFKIFNRLLVRFQSCLFYIEAQGRVHRISFSMSYNTVRWVGLREWLSCKELPWWTPKSKHFGNNQDSPFQIQNSRKLEYLKFWRPFLPSWICVKSEMAFSEKKYMGGMDNLFSVSLSVCLSIHPFIYPPTQLSICPSIYLSIHPSQLFWIMISWNPTTIILK